MEPTSEKAVVEHIDIRDLGEIKRYQRRLNIAIEATQGLFWEADLVTGELHYDRSALARLGLDDDPGLYTLTGWHSQTHPDDQALVKSNREDRYRQNKAFKLEYRVKNRAGEYQWIQSTNFTVQTNLQ